MDVIRTRDDWDAAMASRGINTAEMASRIGSYRSHMSWYTNGKMPWPKRLKNELRAYGIHIEGNVTEPSPHRHRNQCRLCGEEGHNKRTCRKERAAA